MSKTSGFRDVTDQDEINKIVQELRNNELDGYLRRELIFKGYIIESNDYIEIIQIQKQKQMHGTIYKIEANIHTRKGIYENVLIEYYETRITILSKPYKLEQNQSIKIVMIWNGIILCIMFISFLIRGFWKQNNPKTDIYLNLLKRTINHRKTYKKFGNSSVLFKKIIFTGTENLQWTFDSICCQFVHQLIDEDFVQSLQRNIHTAVNDIITKENRAVNRPLLIMKTSIEQFLMNMKNMTLSTDKNTNKIIISISKKIIELSQYDAYKNKNILTILSDIGLFHYKITSIGSEPVFFIDLCNFFEDTHFSDHTFINTQQMLQIFNTSTTLGPNSTFYKKILSNQDMLDIWKKYKKHKHLFRAMHSFTTIFPRLYETLIPKNKWLW